MKHIHLLGLKDYPGEDIQTIIDTAYKFKEIFYSGHLMECGIGLISKK